MAGAEGLEPSNDGTKTRCLTCLATPQRDKDFLEGGNLIMSELIGCPVTTVGVGPDREQTIAVK